jgi:hypothetical protein
MSPRLITLSIVTIHMMKFMCKQPKISMIIGEGNTNFLDKKNHMLYGQAIHICDTAWSERIRKPLISRVGLASSMRRGEAPNRASCLTEAQKSAPFASRLARIGSESLTSLQLAMTLPLFHNPADGFRNIILIQLHPTAYRLHLGQSPLLDSEAPASA